MIKKLLPLCLLCATFSSNTATAAPTSENNDRLRKALERFPEADANKDGVLTLQEATAFRGKVRAGKGESQQGRHRSQKSPVTVSGSAIKPGTEVEGLNGLYMGHSFFRPSAHALLEIIPDSPIENHTQYLVTQGGQGGSPKLMWENERTRTSGQKHLDSGKANLLVMTYYSPEDSSVEHYSKWFDYAISKNPKMTFMIAVPWSKNPHRLDPEDVAGIMKRGRGLRDALIEPLRTKYPENKVLFCPYGAGVYELIQRLDEGKLPGVKYVLNPDRRGRAESQQKKEQLTKDELGHPGELIAELGALIWLQTLYDCDVTSMKPQRVEGLPDVDLNEIADTVYKKIKPFNARYAGNQEQK